MQAYVTKSKAFTKYYHVILGHDRQNLVHPELFVARQIVKKDGINQKTDNGFDKTYEIHPWDLEDQTVYAWNSHANYYTALPAKEKAIINSIKKFINNSGEWKILVSFHNTQCRLGLDSSVCHGNHLHLVVETAVGQLSKHGLYRSMQIQMKKSEGICSMSEIKHHLPQFMRYLAEDPEKTFLGTNSETMREMYKDENTIAGTEKTWNLEQIEEENPVETRKLAAFDFNIAQPSTSKDTDDVKAPEHLQKTKSADSIQFIIELMKKHRNARTLSALAANYDLFSDTGKAICAIATSQQGKKIFDMAMNQLNSELHTETIADIIKKLPDKIPGYMTPYQSQAMFNAWCIEQGISPRRLVCTLQMILDGKSHKRVGIYFSGRPNSGKTAITNSMWDCLSDIVGKITKENFCFQDCANKRIIIGEECSIGVHNIDNYKDLLSGSTLKVPVKNQAPGDCTPAIVMLNSNITYYQNLNTEQTAALRVRLFNFENLKQTRCLKHMTGKFHPRLLYDNVLPISDDEVQYIQQGEHTIWTQEPIGWGLEFTGSWDDIMQNDATNTEQAIDAGMGTKRKRTDTEVHALSEDGGITRSQKIRKSSDTTTGKDEGNIIRTRETGTERRNTDLTGNTSETRQNSSDDEELTEIHETQGNGSNSGKANSKKPTENEEDDDFEITPSQMPRGRTTPDYELEETTKTPAKTSTPEPTPVKTKRLRTKKTAKHELEVKILKDINDKMTDVDIMKMSDNFGEEFWKYARKITHDMETCKVTMIRKAAELERDGADSAWSKVSTRKDYVTLIRSLDLPYTLPTHNKHDIDRHIAGYLRRMSSFVLSAVKYETINYLYQKKQKQNEAPFTYKITYYKSDEPNLPKRRWSYGDPDATWDPASISFVPDREIETGDPDDYHVHSTHFVHSYLNNPSAKDKLRTTITYKSYNNETILVLGLECRPARKTKWIRDITIQSNDERDIVKCKPLCPPTELSEEELDEETIAWKHLQIGCAFRALTNRPCKEFYTGQVHHTTKGNLITRYLDFLRLNIPLIRLCHSNHYRMLLLIEHVFEMMFHDHLAFIFPVENFTDSSHYRERKPKA